MVPGSNPDPNADLGVVGFLIKAIDLFRENNRCNRVSRIYFRRIAYDLFPKAKKTGLKREKSAMVYAVIGPCYYFYGVYYCKFRSINIFLMTKKSYIPFLKKVMVLILLICPYF